MKNNYAAAMGNARGLFMKQDMQQMLSRFPIDGDDGFLYVRLVGEVYRVDRLQGNILRPDGTDADYEETMCIYDYLSGSGPVAPGEQWCLVNSLPGVGFNSGVGENTFGNLAEEIDRNPEAFCRCCEAMRGKPLDWKDLSYELQLLPGLPLRLRFSFSDTEFPAQLLVLWHSRTLQMLRYETTFYGDSCLRKKISNALKSGKE